MKMMAVGVDAHKLSCTACTFEGRTKKGLFEFPTTVQGVQSFTSRVSEGSGVVLESSTTGKVLSKLLSERWEVHIVAPPETKPSVKTNKRDAEKIAKEDMLGYISRCYIPSKHVEEMRSLAARQMRIGEAFSFDEVNLRQLGERKATYSPH